MLILKSQRQANMPPQPSSVVLEIQMVLVLRTTNGMDGWKIFQNGSRKSICKTKKEKKASEHKKPTSLL